MKLADEPTTSIRDFQRWHTWVISHRHIAVRLKYQIFKRGYFVGFFGRTRKLCPIRQGMLRQHWMNGFAVGADARSLIRRGGTR